MPHRFWAVERGKVRFIELKKIFSNLIIKLAGRLTKEEEKFGRTSGH